MFEDGFDDQARRETMGLDDVRTDPGAAGVRSIRLSASGVESVYGLSPDLPALSTEHIIAQLQQLRDLLSAPAGDGHG